jgi:hypothetical protein
VYHKLASRFVYLWILRHYSQYKCHACVSIATNFGALTRSCMLWRIVINVIREENGTYLLFLPAVVRSTYIIINICCSFEMTRRQDPSSVGAGIRLFAPHAYSVSEHTHRPINWVLGTPRNKAAEAWNPSFRNVWGISSISPHVFIGWCLNVVHKNGVNLFILLPITMWFKLHFALMASEH